MKPNIIIISVMSFLFFEIVMGFIWSHYDYRTYQGGNSGRGIIELQYY